MTSGRFKDFGTSSKEYQPLSFKINGEVFHAYPAIQGKVLLDFAKAGEDASAAIQMMEDFYEKVLKPESYKKFQKMITSETEIVEAETLAEIVSWLMEEYTNRPEAQ